MTDHNTTDLQGSIKEQHRQGSLHPADPDMLLSRKGYSQNRVDPAGQSSLSGEQTGAGVQSSGKEERRKIGGIQRIVPFFIAFVLDLLIAVVIFRMVYAPSSNAKNSDASAGADTGRTVAPDAIVEITDPVLKKTIQDSLGIGDQEITGKDALSLTELVYESYDNEKYEEKDHVKDITGLSAFKNLTYLALEDNDLSDINELSGLTNLTRLNISFNHLRDISALSGLTNLTSLDLSFNQLNDINALSGLTNLTELHLSFNRLSGISALSGLTNLEKLYLGHNQLSDIRALSRLTNLTELVLWDNEVSNISALSYLTNLTRLDLGYNEVSDIGALSCLMNLTDLDLDRNQVSDIRALSGLAKLERLGLSDNPVVENKSREEIMEILSGAENLTDMFFLH